MQLDLILGQRRSRLIVIWVKSESNVFHAKPVLVLYSYATMDLEGLFHANEMVMHFVETGVATVCAL